LHYRFFFIFTRQVTVAAHRHSGYNGVRKNPDAVISDFETQSSVFNKKTLESAYFKGFFGGGQGLEPWTP